MSRFTWPSKDRRRRLPRKTFLYRGDLYTSVSSTKLPTRSLSWNTTILHFQHNMLTGKSHHLQFAITKTKCSHLLMLMRSNCIDPLTLGAPFSRRYSAVRIWSILDSSLLALSIAFPVRVPLIRTISVVRFWRDLVTLSCKIPHIRKIVQGFQRI